MAARSIMVGAALVVSPGMIKVSGSKVSVVVLVYAPLLMAELWGIRCGLKLAKERNWKGAIIETDSKVATDLIHPCDVDNHPEKVLIQDCRNLMDEMEASVIHTLREGNRCADILAKMGINQGEQDIKVNVPPTEIVEALKADLIGASFSRGF